MTTQPVEANVVLTADNSQYDQAMVSSAGSTNDLAKAVDTLGVKISSLTKTAGKTLIGISAADVALIGTAVAAWSSYEKQMSRLQAQSAILTRTQDSQSRVMKDYTLAVKGLRSEYGTTTAEASKLVETLSKVTNIRQTRALTDLSKVFVDMSKATGESSSGLASSLTNLQKVMGTDVASPNTKKYADMFTYLSAQTQGTTQGLIDFTAQLAPTGEALGMNQKQIAGFATAFTKAGQEGVGASTVFTKITTDISRAIAGGGPELQQYANIIGVTGEQFTKMVKEDSGEAVVRIMEAITTQGDQGIQTLQRLNLDGTKHIRALSAVMNEPGGIRAAVGQANIGYESGVNSKAAQETMKGLSDEFEKIQEEMKKTAETMATLLGPAVGKFASLFEHLASNINDVLEGPLGDFLQVIMAVVAPLAGGAGALLLFAGAILKVAAAFAVWRNSMSLGAREGFRGGSMIGGPNVGERGAQIAQGGTWMQRTMYNMGQPVGALAGGSAGLIRQGWQGGRAWADPNYTPGGPRSMLSYAAGGMGRAIQNFVTPQFDQMRYADPSKRTPQFFSRDAPWTMRGMGREADAAGAAASREAENLKRIRQEEAAVRGGAVTPLTETGKATKLEELKAAREETKTRMAAARETERATRAEIDARRANTGGIRDNTTGFTRLTRATGGFLAGTGGALKGGALAAGDAIGRSGMGWQAGGMAAMALQGAAGVKSNTLMMGSMGAMLGPWGAAGGAAIGAGLDMAQSNNDVMDNLDALNEAIETGGYQFTGMADAAADSQEDMKKWSDEVTGAREGKNLPFAKGDILDLGSTKNWVEGVLGSSDVEEAQAKFDEAEKKYNDKVGAAKEMAKQSGVMMYGSAGAQLEQLEKFMNEKGAAQLAEAGVTYDDVVKAFNTGGSDWAEMLAKIKTGGDTTLEGRLAAGGGTGATMINSAEGQRALKYQDDVGAFYTATTKIFDEALESGADFTQIMKQSQGAMKDIGEENNRYYEIQMAVFQRAQQLQGLAMSTDTRAGAFQTQINSTQTLLQDTPNTPSGLAQKQAMKDQTAGAVADQVQYFKQLLLAQEQFDRQRARAQDDYNLQRQYQDYDYNLQRSRAEENFARQRARATSDFYRSMRRAHYDFNLGRQRQEEDFNHSVEIMAKQQAQGIYDIYQRVQTERTNSASWVLSNAQDQLEKMREQSENLDTLRGRGLSNTAIQQLQLNSPENAQQLARFVTEMTPQMIRQFNKTAGAERVKAARDLVTDSSSLEWTEMRRGYRIARERAGEDFERQMKISRQDFRRGLDRQDKDFKLSMDQQAEDYETSVVRQEKAYKQSMDRAAEDMKHMADEISGSLEEVLIKSTNKLSGSAKKQAEAVLKSFRDLKKDTTPEAISLMKELAETFGFAYKPPKMGGSTDTYSPRDAGDEFGQRGGFHEGGMVPGWAPGRDTHTIAVGGGEGILRPEATRAIGGEKVIDALNHMAKHGAFASGGVFWPVPGHTTGTYPGHDGVDINRGSGSDDYGDPIRAFRSGTITYVGSGHGYGDAIFERTAAGTVVYGHTSGQSVHAGQMVRAGQLIGQVGSTGHSSSPHLHFGIPGGSYDQAMALLAGAIVGGGGFADMDMAGGGGGIASLRGLLKHRYPNAERAARNMEGVHPLEPGMISKVINRFARQKVRELGGGGPGVPGGANIGHEPNEHLNNEQIVHVGANRLGWGNQWGQLRELVMHESGFNNTAQNPKSTAYGMFQFLDGTWAGYGGRKTSDPWKQTQYGLKYIKNRYGDPRGAWDFWQDHNWYGNGAVFDKAQTIGVGESGPEAVIPLNARGADFMMDVMGSVMGGRNVSPMGGGMSVYNTKVDRSTNFTGPITVQANDPAELINKLRSRQRVMALSRPSLTGSAA